MHDPTLKLATSARYFTAREIPIDRSRSDLPWPTTIALVKAASRTPVKRLTGMKYAGFFDINYRYYNELQYIDN
jgi:hypothetical protein